MDNEGRTPVDSGLVEEHANLSALVFQNEPLICIGLEQIIKPDVGDEEFFGSANSCHSSHLPILLINVVNSMDHLLLVKLRGFRCGFDNVVVYGVESDLDQIELLLENV